MSIGYRYDNEIIIEISDSIIYDNKLKATGVMTS